MKRLYLLFALALVAGTVQFTLPSTAQADTTLSSLILLQTVPPTLIVEAQADATAQPNTSSSWGRIKVMYRGDREVTPSAAVQDTVVSTRIRKPGAETTAMSSYSSYISSWKLPFCGSWQISCYYGCSYYHQGNDYFAVDWNLPGWNDFNQAVPAPAAGMVRYAGWRSGYGNTVEVDAGNQYFYRIAHLNSIGVSAGQWVNQGSYLGACGNSGASQGPHIHFAIYFPARWAGYIQKAGDNPWGHGMSVPQEGISSQYWLREWSYYPSGQYCQSR